MRIPFGIVTLCLLTSAAGCKSSKSTDTPPPGTGATAGSSESSAPVTVTLLAKSGSTLKGSATFTDTGSGVKVRLEVSGIPPGKHGAHIHETPDCSAEDAKSAGEHYNPHGKEHSMKEDEGHIGDLGNLEIGEDGKGTLEVTIEKANLKAGGDPNSFRERSIIVHEKEDDGGQPSGNAGARLGCAEIR